MILPLVSPSPATPSHGTAAIRCAGRSTRGTDFEALLAQAGQIGTDIAALLGGSMATAIASPLPPAGAGPIIAGGAGVGAGPLPHCSDASGAVALGLAGSHGMTSAAVLSGAAAGAASLGGSVEIAAPAAAGAATAAGSSGAAADALAGLTTTEAPGDTQPISATVPSPRAEHSAEGSGPPNLAGAPLPPGLAARLADGRLSPDSLPGRYGDGHPGRDLDGRTGRTTIPATHATPAEPAIPAAGTEPGAAAATPASPAIPAVPAEAGDLPAPEAPSELLPGAAAARRDTAPDAHTRTAASDGLRAELGASTPIGSQGPVSPHVGAASEAPETAAALPVRIAELARRRSGTTEQVVVRLDPPELGSVRISLTARGDQVHVVVRADTPEARTALDAQRGNVEQLLRGEGFDLSSFDVGHQRREHEQRGSRPAGPQLRFAADLLDVPDTSAPAADGALRL